MVPRLYFDYSATTPLHPEVREIMLAALERFHGNPSSMHSHGKKSRDALENAREKVAAGIGADREEIVFTSGATEANNLALRGILKCCSPNRNHLIISAVEHHAVLHTAEALEAEGYQLTILPVDHEGLVSTDTLKEKIRPETALVSIMMVNNEVGTIQNIKRLARVARKKGVAFHSDAVQAVPYMDLNVKKLRLDLLSLSAHKMYGPKGIGALFIRQGTEITPSFFGGAQEGKLRPGTENIFGILGLGAAMEIRTREMEKRKKHLQDLRSLLIEGLKNVYPDCLINGSKKKSAPHIISVAFPGVDGESLLFHLNLNGASVSLGSACTSEDLEPSHVLTAMGLSTEIIDSTLRISLGEPTSTTEIDELLGILPAALDKARLG